MRLVTWNCKGALRRKLPLVAKYSPDILVVPEAENTDGLERAVWIGRTPRKGLGVLAFGDYSVEIHPAYEPRHTWVLPVRVRGPHPFTLFAVWTVPSKERRYYAQPVIEAAHTYRLLARGRDVVWAGDFNSNVALDGTRRAFRFRHFLEQMTGRGLRSVYHHVHGYEHGGEPESTFYLHHNSAKGFHIDFVFASAGLLSIASSVESGDHATWAKSSDHMPVACDFAENAIQDEGVGSAAFP